jgi:hypothetical protein
MKAWFWRVIAAAALLAVGIWLWTILFPSPERVIRSRLTDLAKTASFSGNESPLAAFANAQKVAGFFTAEIEIKADVPGRSPVVLSGREILFQTVMHARSAFAGLQAEFYDIAVSIAPDKKSADANLTLKARVTGERDIIIQELKVWLNKAEGDWRIFRLETVKTLSLRITEPRLRLSPIIDTL